MADPFGRRDEDDPQQTSTDYLGAESPVAFEGQPALPIGGGPAVGAPSGPVTSGGFAPNSAPSTVTGTPTTPPTPGGGVSTRSADPGLLGEIGPYIAPGLKLLEVANRLMNPPSDFTPGAFGATETPSGATTVTAPDILRDRLFPEPPPDVNAVPPETGLPTGGPPASDVGPSFVPPDVLGGPPPPAGGAPPSGVDLSGNFGTTMPTPSPGASDFLAQSPITDDIVAMFGGDRAAVEAAFANAHASFTPEVVQTMADAGQLESTMGLPAGTQLNPAQIATAQNTLAVASLIITGLRMAGVIDQTAGTVLSSMVSLAAGGLALASLAPALEAGFSTFSTAFSAVSAIGGSVTAVLAPFIAWGMHSLEMAMRPNVNPITRRLNEQLYTATAHDVSLFNQAVDFVQQTNLQDPVILNQLMQAGEARVLNFYNAFIQVAPGGVRGETNASPSGGIVPGREAEMMAPFQKAMRNLAMLDARTGSTYTGANDWYGIYGGQLNPAPLGYDPAMGGTGLNAAQYGEQFTPEELRAAASGLDPLDWAMVQWEEAGILPRSNRSRGTPQAAAPLRPSPVGVSSDSEGSGEGGGAAE